MLPLVSPEAPSGPLGSRVALVPHTKLPKDHGLVDVHTRLARTGQRGHQQCRQPWWELMNSAKRERLAATRRAQAAQSPSLLNVVAVWLTWANGAINPVIYAVRNPNISMLLGRNREEGYRTRNVDALLPNQGRALQAGSLNPLRNRYTNRLGAWSTMSSSNPTSGVAGDMAMWARKNPVVLFCREGPPDPVTAAAKQSESGDTSL